MFRTIKICLFLRSISDIHIAYQTRTRHRAPQILSGTKHPCTTMRQCGRSWSGSERAGARGRERGAGARGREREGGCAAVSRKQCRGKRPEASAPRSAARLRRGPLPGKQPRPGRAVGGGGRARRREPRLTACSRAGRRARGLRRREGAARGAGAEARVARGGRRRGSREGGGEPAPHPPGGAEPIPAAAPGAGRSETSGSGGVSHGLGGFPARARTGRPAEAPFSRSGRSWPRLGRS